MLLRQVVIPLTPYTQYLALVEADRKKDCHGRRNDPNKAEKQVVESFVKNTTHN